MQTTIQLLSPMEKSWRSGRKKTFLRRTEGERSARRRDRVSAIVTGEGEHYIEVRTDAPVKVAVYREGMCRATLSAYRQVR